MNDIIFPLQDLLRNHISFLLEHGALRQSKDILLYAIPLMDCLRRQRQEGVKTGD